MQPAPATGDLPDDDLEAEVLDDGGGSTSAHAAPHEQAQPLPSPVGPIIFVLGPPGSGKTTVCARLAQRFGCRVLSAPDLMRAAVQAGGTQGTMIQNMIKSGQIVPAQVTLNLLLAAMRDCHAPAYLFDSFPRSIDNLEAFEAQAGRCAAALVLDADEELLTARLLERGQTSGRTDDNRETIGRRFKTYLQQALPVIDSLALRGQVTRLDASLSLQQVCTAADEAYEIAVPVTSSG